MKIIASIDIDAGNLSFVLDLTSLLIINH